MRFVTLTIFILLSALTASAQSLLDTFESSLKSLGLYRVEFDVSLDGDYTLKGEYIVDKQNFYVKLGGVELYVTDGVKYEVVAQRGEVVIDSADSLGSDLLSNPAGAFVRLKEQYSISPSSVGGRAAVNLKSKEGEDSAVVVADSSGVLPGRIEYSHSGSVVSITFSSIASYKDSLPTFDRSKYAAYEVVDMR